MTTTATTPDVPLRMELTFELPGTPEQVWDAIATANGISSWFLPTDLEEREGGAVRFHMGETDSAGTVTGWDPPRRLVYEEPEWATLVGQPSDAVTPLVTEFLVEARSGGTCVLRVVSSGFGTGADWEREFFDDMERHWTPTFDTLRRYLTHFPGRRVTTMGAEADVPGPPEAISAALRRALGAGVVGDPVRVRGVSGHVERVGTSPGPEEVLVRLTGPVPGFLLFQVHGRDDGRSSAAVAGHLFSPDAPAYVEREQPGWAAWLRELAVPAG